MTLTDIAARVGQDAFGSYRPEAILALAELTTDQIGIMLGGPKAATDPPDGGMTEREYHRMRAIYNGWPQWLEEKEWAARHPDP